MLEPLEENVWFLSQLDNTVGYGLSVKLLGHSQDIVTRIGWVDERKFDSIVKAMGLKDFGAVLTHEQVKELITCLQYIDHMMEKRNANTSTEPD